MARVSQQLRLLQLFHAVGAANHSVLRNRLRGLLDHAPLGEGLRRGRAALGHGEGEQDLVVPADIDVKRS